MGSFLSDDDISKLRQAILKMDFLLGLPDEEIMQFIESLEKSHHKKGSTLIFQGEISNRLYLIAFGKVSVWVKPPKSQERLRVAELNAGDYFGEISLLEPITASATLKAEEDTDLFSITREKFTAIVDKFPGTTDLIRTKIQQRKEQLAKTQEKK